MNLFTQIGRTENFGTGIPQKELAEKAALSRRGIEWNLSQMKQKGILIRVGADKGGYWQINRMPE